MPRTRNSVDRPFFFLVVALVAIGFLIFSSASLGLLAREGASFSSVATSQVLFGIIGGGIALLLVSRIHYRIYRKFAVPLFLVSIAATLLVFIPSLGWSHAGATRWIDLGFTTFQPAELLKLGFVVFLAAWFSKNRTKINHIQFGLLPFLGILGVTGLILLLQPDTGTFLVLLSTGFAMFLAAGARLRDIAGIFAASSAMLAGLVLFRPYLKERILTFLDPAIDPLGISYQIKQSLIAIGSGNLLGRGFGQSIQKFDYLPEPIGDSIFAVFAEEFGFIGVLLLIFLFIFFALRGLKIASQAPDQFGGLLVTGIVILIVSQSFINIGSMTGLLPLTGLPLLFVSQGGSALFLALIEVGIVLNVSRYIRKKDAKR
jgi:cell division protein FtsW